MRFQLFRKPDGDRSRWERGQAMVEVALLLPFIFVLLLMVIEFGFLMWTHLNVNASAREAARFAAVGNIAGEIDDSDPTCGAIPGAPPAAERRTVRGRAVEASLTRIKCSDVTVVGYRPSPFNPGPHIPDRGDEVVVQIDLPYPGITPLVGMMAAVGMGVLPDPISLHACASARLERPYPTDVAEPDGITGSCRP